jgi:hypothetical protein
MRILGFNSVYIRYGENWINFIDKVEKLVKRKDCHIIHTSVAETNEDSIVCIKNSDNSILWSLYYNYIEEGERHVFPHRRPDSPLVQTYSFHRLAGEYIDLDILPCIVPDNPMVGCIVYEEIDIVKYKQCGDKIITENVNHEVIIASSKLSFDGSMRTHEWEFSEWEFSEHFNILETNKKLKDKINELKKEIVELRGKSIDWSGETEEGIF